MSSLAWRAVRAPADDAELVRPGALREPAAADALWDAYGPGAFAFCQRVMGEVAAAADAAQDAFLLAVAEPPEPGFRLGLLRAARTTSFELLGGRTRSVPPRARGVLSAAAGRLRPQQRAALALTGLEGLSYADTAVVLGLAPQFVPALVARARMRLHDELHGTALAAAAVASSDCEDVLPLLAAAADGELAPADAAWADPHVERCAACRRTIRALRTAAATYAAWSPAPAPTWLRGATLAEVAAGEPAVASARQPVLSATLVSATLVTAASAALLVVGAGSLRGDEVSLGGARLAGAGRTMPMAAIVAGPVGAGQRARRAESRARERPVVPLRSRASSAVAPPAAGPPPASRPAPSARRVSRLELAPTRRLASSAPVSDVGAPGTSAPVDTAAPAADAPVAANTGTTAVAAAASTSASPPPAEPPPAQTAAALPPPKTVVTPPPVPAGADEDGGQPPCRGRDG
jgi:DNA-directed RNA polymerase specialized sigma24 family protein